MRFRKFQSSNNPTFINLGRAYPNPLLTMVIWGVRTKAMRPSPKDVGNKMIVPGKVELYKENPQIVIRWQNQFEIVQDAQGELQ